MISAIFIVFTFFKRVSYILPYNLSPTQQTQIQPTTAAHTVHIGDGVSTATVAVVISAMAILCSVVITIAFILSARKQRREAERMILEDEEDEEEGEEENKEDFEDGDFADKHNEFEYKTEDLSENGPKEEMLSDIDDVMETDDEN